MTKSDLIDRLCATLKLPKVKVEAIIDTIFDSLQDGLRRDERIEIRGFGSFEMRRYRAYGGRNPRTGAAVEVRPKRLPFFKAGKELRDRANERVARAGRQAHVSRPSMTPAPLAIPPVGAATPAPQATEPARIGPANDAPAVARPEAFPRLAIR